MPVTASNRNPSLKQALIEGKTLVADRYIASNLAHQGARSSPEKRDEFLKWLKQLEYEIYASAARGSGHLLARSSGRGASPGRDKRAARVHAARTRHCRKRTSRIWNAASAVYDELAKQPHWITIECFDAATKTLRSPGSIHKEISRRLNRERFARPT